MEQNTPSTAAKNVHWRLAIDDNEPVIFRQSKGDSDIKRYRTDIPCATACEQKALVKFLFPPGAPSLDLFTLYTATSFSSPVGRLITKTKTSLGITAIIIHFLRSSQQLGYVLTPLMKKCVVRGSYSGKNTTGEKRVRLCMIYKSDESLWADVDVRVCELAERFITDEKNEEMKQALNDPERSTQMKLIIKEFIQFKLIFTLTSI